MVAKTKLNNIISKDQFLIRIIRHIKSSPCGGIKSGINTNIRKHHISQSYDNVAKLTDFNMSVKEIIMSNFFNTCDPDISIKDNLVSTLPSPKKKQRSYRTNAGHS